MTITLISHCHLHQRLLKLEPEEEIPLGDTCQRITVACNKKNQNLLDGWLDDTQLGLPSQEAISMGKKIFQKYYVSFISQSIKVFRQSFI